MQKHAILVWEKYQEQLAERNGEATDADVYIEARARFATLFSEGDFGE